jgi:cytochrome c oxidase cbb3-type subunit 3
MLPFGAVNETTVGALLLACVGSLGLLGAAACDQPPSADSLPEWKPTDHHSADDNGGQASGQQAAPNAGAGAGAARGTDVAQLVDLTWRQQCSQCHGMSGRGDGQMGPMLHTRDLTDPDWQRKVSDADIATTIRTGKDKMPKFDLPDPVLQGLVARVRQLKGS